MPDRDRIVLLHSALGDSRLWARQVELLRGRGYDVVAPDLPGFGDAPEPHEPFSFVELVADLLPAVLVGNSFGGGIALRVALELQTGRAPPEVTWPKQRPLSELAMPALVVVGDRDHSDFLAIGERIAREAPNARLEVVSGAGHLVAIEAPDAFERLLLEFLELPD